MPSWSPLIINHKRSVKVLLKVSYICMGTAKEVKFFLLKLTSMHNN